MSDLITPCNQCGGTSFGFGQTTGQAVVFPLNKLFARGSSAIFTICTDCGEVQSIRVENPEKFKKQ
ncbi:hypothetical protein I8J29_22630 [Paenibacillus sp. MWE-103]|uniref:Transcription initiation factor TFIIIB n=1 Tax=Paenibacillus artemisiicola TaxID=1172618 RepID=A0ABS3WFA3_9BACL|nr:hypothetical protein [Paenibacillus artemisiicola]MBO7747004.1 hypothetical protein [Paenibacillus artemisiicola]